MRALLLIAIVIAGCSTGPDTAEPDPPIAVADLFTIEPGDTWSFGEYELRAIADTTIATTHYVRVTSNGAMGMQGVWYLGGRQNAAAAIQYSQSGIYRRISLYPGGLDGKQEYRTTPFEGIPTTGAARVTVLGWAQGQFGFRVSTHRLATDTAWTDAHEWWFSPGEGAVDWRVSAAGGWEIHARTP